MHWLLISLLCACASAEYRNFLPKSQSAASEAQIKFALENNYDNTGPGSMQKETAYNTYPNLDDAILSYINDPDTKLPEYEKSKAINKLLKTNKYTKVIHPYLPKQVIDFGLKPDEPTKGYWNFKEFPLRGEKLREDHHKISFLKSSPVNLGFYTREGGDTRPVTPSPLYSLVFDVTDKPNNFSPRPGHGDYLRGYYSVKDGDGKTRIIQYTVNHKGYSASERKTDVV